MFNYFQQSYEEQQSKFGKRTHLVRTYLKTLSHWIYFSIFSTRPLEKKAIYANFKEYATFIQEFGIAELLFRWGHIDICFGDGGSISSSDLEHMNKVTEENIQVVKMAEGDVALLDNYKCLHGRKSYSGTRKHGVAFFGGWEGEGDEDLKR